MLNLWIAAALVMPATRVETRPVPSRLEAPASIATAFDYGCDDGTIGGTLVQRGEAYYGNRFETACATGKLTKARWMHFGYGLSGDYQFRLHLLDAACQEIAVTPILTIPGAPDAIASAEVDLTSFGWCVTNGFALLLEPLSCADAPDAQDCFPALLVDASTDGDPASHCGVLSAPSGDGRECLSPQSADGRFFDFRLRVEIACAAPGCAVAVHPGTWSQVKRLYRD
jgi:hypothetical protein